MFKQKFLTKEAIAIGSPIIIGMVSTTIMNIADIAMVGRLGATAIAAVGLCGIFFYTIASFVSSLGVGVQTVVARRFGESQYPETGKVLWNALFLALVIGVPLTFLGVQFGDEFLSILNQDLMVVSLGEGYIRIRFLSIGFVAVSMAFQGFYNGISRTRVHLKVTVSANALNVLLNYLLIFGKFGFPEMGVDGAALGSTLAMFFAAVNYAIVGFKDPLRIEYNFLRPKGLSGMMLRKIVLLSTPVALQNIVVHAGFTMFFVIIGQISTIALAASEIVFNILSFSFMPGFGMGLAAGTMIGKYLGLRDLYQAERSGWLVMRLTIYFMGSIGLVFLLVPENILQFFTQDTAVIMEGKIALRILGAIQFVDACGLSIAGALRGAGDTTYVGIIEIVINLIIFLPLTYMLSLRAGFGLVGAWFGFAIYIILFAIAMIMRFRQGHWKMIEV